MEQVFRDRVDAGKRLAGALRHLASRRPLVLGLARGGVVLAAEIARELDCDMDVLVARKVGAPHHPEYGIGAVAPGGVEVADPDVLSRLYLSESEFAQLADRERAELERRIRTYTAGRKPLHPEGRTVIVTDDGLATGVTAIAACRYVRTLNPEHLVLAVPVTSSSAREAVEKEVDEFVALAEPEHFYAVGQWYDKFHQVLDSEVMTLLDGAPR